MSIGHVLCRTVRPSAAVLDATHGLARGGPCDAPAHTGRFADAVARDPGSLRIGWSTAGRPGVTVSAEVAGAVEATAGSLEAQGHRVHEQSLDHIDWAGFGDAFSTVTV
jgi:amidase